MTVVVSCSPIPEYSTYFFTSEGLSLVFIVLHLEIALESKTSHNDPSPTMPLSLETSGSTDLCVYPRRYSVCYAFVS